MRGSSVSHYFIPHQNRTAEPKTSDRACKLANALAERDKSRLSDSLPGTPCRVCEGPSWYWSSALSVRSNRTKRSCFGTARLPRSAATTRATCKPWCPDVARRHHRAVTSRHAPSSLPLNFWFYVNATRSIRAFHWMNDRKHFFLFFLLTYYRLKEHCIVRLENLSLIIITYTYTYNVRAEKL